MKLAQGAEAVITKEKDAVVKERIAKDYRHPAIDEKLRRQRTRREARILESLAAAGFPVPRVREIDDLQMRLVMDFLDGRQVKEVLHENPRVLAREIGRKVGLLHAKNIIHADLTTSNMIHHKGEIHFIDFGLSFVSQKVEDKAVDLHLLDRALESRHYEIYEDCIAEVLEGYKEAYPGAQLVLQRWETAVQLRGRNKRKAA